MEIGDARDDIKTKDGGVMEYMGNTLARGYYYSVCGNGSKHARKGV
ncbi:hypothetical protein GCM10011389_08670 [Pontibacillus salipaludis]|uniref:Uncharacterized protein n=1 Tax=Pontibacillus salipaludis TaxID=1697394 RepID=A0ABQ1PU22_9BACI|nr:hypothetical protein GCM10011389_08670 [Pontibacillus salipaludis]